MTAALLPVVGVDLSMQSTGLATADGVRTIRSSGKAGASLRVRHARLAAIATEVTLAVSEAAAPRCALVVIEGPSLGQQRQSGTHDRSGLWWLTVGELLSAGHLVAEVPPATLKKYATGVGNSKKTALVDAAARRMPHIETGGQDDVVDALWLRAMGCARYGIPICSVPKTHTAALDAVQWPDIDAWGVAA